jgi:hypothetical protein
MTCAVCSDTIKVIKDNRTKYCSRYCKENERRLKFESSRPQVVVFSGKTKLLEDKFIVNEEYYDWLSIYKWQLSTTGYAFIMKKVSGKNKAVRLHRLLMNAQPGQFVDHENRNKLDNTMSNLRFLTSRENSFNTDRTENAKYYFWNKQESKWVVKRFGKRFAAFKYEASAIDYVEKHIRYMPIPEWGNMYQYRKDLLAKKQGMYSAIPNGDR